MPALAPQEEFQTVTRRANTRNARPVSSRARGTQAREAQTRETQTRIAQPERAFEEPRVLAPDEAPQEIGEAPHEEVAARTRHRAHRDLKVPLTVGFFTVLLFAQLIAVLLFKGMSFTAMHRAEKLGDATSGDIGHVNDEIAMTQKQIASLGSPAQIKRWADAKGWKMASPQSFDDIRQTAPMPQNSSVANENGKPQQPLSH